MDCYGVQIMEEDTESQGSRKGLSPPLITNQVNSFNVGNSTVDAGRDAHVRLDGATSAIDESEPLLSVTQRLKEKREGEA
jgi:hypothetical protein